MPRGRIAPMLGRLNTRDGGDASKSREVRDVLLHERAQRSARERARAFARLALTPTPPTLSRGPRGPGEGDQIVHVRVHDPDPVPSPRGAGRGLERGAVFPGPCARPT